METTTSLKFDSKCSLFIIGAIIVSNFASAGYAFTIVIIFADDYPAYLQLDKIETSLIGSVTIGSFLLSVPFTAPFCRKIGARAGSMLGSLLIVLSTVIHAFAKEVWQFVCGFSLPLGIGSSLILSASVQIVPHYFKKWRDPAMVAIGAGASLGNVILPHIIASLTKMGLDLHTITLCLLGICPLLFLAPVAFKQRINDTTETNRRVKLSDIIDPLKKCITPSYLLNGYLWNAGFIGFGYLLFTHMEKEFGLSGAVLALNVFGIGEIVASIFMQLLTFKFNLNHVLVQIILCLVGGLAVLTFGLISHYETKLFLSFMVGVCSQIAVTIIPSLAFYAYPDNETYMAFGYQEAAGGIGGLVSTVSSSAIVTIYGDRAVYFYISAQLIAAGVLYIVTALLFKPFFKPQNSESISECSYKLEEREEEEESADKPDPKTQITGYEHEISTE